VVLSSKKKISLGSSGVCQLLSRDSKTKYVNPCSSIVDYNFFIPNMYVAAATALGITPQEFLLQQVTISLLFLSLQFKTFFVNILGEVKAKHSVTEKFDSIMPGNNKIIDMCQHLPEMLP
jgi:hypothetical protein